ncbi:molybdenum cofactor synthesis domain-containing protein [Metallosphaera javensis (ex Sakai et al. 2022)]|uniref:molybdenum cofactor synthesis domain-containing protein n=1 Tax=Metallosphaera javensis (ex Sakai et al. 2022) TaxID=2775498 RepID=UPI002589B40E|nr:MAG: molybdopterin molybdenumtransferase MoeA [Metallosphaera javensis (ex Sakai et al. 2022)]
MRNFVPEENLPTPQEAVELFLKTVPPKRRVISVGILDSVGKVTASPVLANTDYPPFSRSTVDGFAVKSSSTPGKFRIVDKISIGEWKDITLGPGEAVEVDTGSPIPWGADAVVKIEDTHVEFPFVEINSRMRFGANVAWAGSDIPKGSEIMGELQEVTAEDVGALASVGVEKVEVYDLPKVYVIATGDELVQPGADLAPGKIYESNVHFLVSRLAQLGCRVIGTEVLPDNKERIRDSLKMAVETADLIITTGGTSAGEKDYIHQLIKEMGKIVVQGINTKPGKPTILGEIRGKPVFGLSGNIVATIMTFNQLVEKYIGEFSGRSMATRRAYHGKITAISILPIQADRFRVTNIPVYLVKGQGRYYAIPVPFDSYMVGTFAGSDGYVTLPPGTQVKEGEEIEVTVKSLDNRPVIIGEEDVRIREVKARKILLGTVPACAALKYGVGDALILSDFLCREDVPDAVEVRRWIISQGEGDPVSYHDWIGMSRLVKEPAVKLKSPSTAPLFLGKGKVIAPQGYIDGERVTQERLKVIVRNRDLQFLEGIFSEST